MILTFNFFIIHVSTCVIGGNVNWALLPWQRVLKRIAHVEETPGNNNIVVKSHIKTDLLQKKEFVKDFLHAIKDHCLQSRQLIRVINSMNSALFYLEILSNLEMLVFHVI